MDILTRGALTHKRKEYVQENFYTEKFKFSYINRVLNSKNSIVTSKTTSFPTSLTFTIIKASYIFLRERNREK